jgi:pyruvate formate lyase activating enzyme
MSKIVVGGVEKFSAVDFPGKLSAVVFMQGCPWKCPFCHNASIREILSENEFSWQLFIEFLKSRVGKLDAVTFSGGEPLVQEGLYEAINDVKEMGFQIGLHTGGYRPEHLAKILPLIDWVGLDIKAPFTSDHYKKIIMIRCKRSFNI